MIPKNAINLGENNILGWAAKSTQLGSVIDAGGIRQQREVLKVASNAATPTYNVKAVLFAEVTGGSGGNGVKTAQNRGATVAASSVAPAADGKTLNFFAAEVAGANALVEVVYLTTDAPLDANGVAAAKLSDNVPGL